MSRRKFEPWSSAAQVCHPLAAATHRASRASGAWWAGMPKTTAAAVSGIAAMIQRTMFPFLARLGTFSNDVVIPHRFVTYAEWPVPLLPLSKPSDVTARLPPRSTWRWPAQRPCSPHVRRQRPLALLREGRGGLTAGAPHRSCPHSRSLSAVLTTARATVHTGGGPTSGVHPSSMGRQRRSAWLGHIWR
jgi:hypothetical protein